MIVDRAKISIKAGNGGNGCVSFHREKYVNAGGPDGGDGGRGGDVIFEVSNDLRTLVEFKYQKKFYAENGLSGGKANMTGRSGEDSIVKVPPGTVIIDADTLEIVADLGQSSEPVLVLKGGNGGQGNARFATSTRKAPRFALPGGKTVNHNIILELKSIADVGLIGFPNVGKSTLLSVISAARPKIANYHFTTLSANLGVVGFHDQSFIAADIPGLIEGAAEGAGLGHEFLRHIERTRMLLHLLDISGHEGRDPLADYYTVRKELGEHSPALLERPEIIVANKIEIDGAEDNLKKLRAELPDSEIFPISAAMREGLEPLLARVCEVLRELPEQTVFEGEGVIERWAKAEELTFEVFRGMDGTIEANGNLIAVIFERTDPNDPDSMRHFEKLLKDMGINKALRKFGAKDGDTVRLNGVEFDFVD